MHFAVMLNLGLARRLHDLVREHPDFEVLHEPTLDLYCCRYVPNALEEQREEPGFEANWVGLARRS
jgi:glutamate/tyrosine decarboxylase-like PLP-dependent enzyme